MSQYPTDIPEVGGNLDQGAYILAVKTASDDVPTKPPGNKKQITVVYTVVEPALLKGSQHTERYVIGTESDPQALDPLTWKTPPSVYAASRFAQLLDNANVGRSGDTAKDFAALVGQHVGALIQVKVEPAKRRQRQPDGTFIEVDNQYVGQERAEIRKFFKPGERTPGVGDGKPAARPTGPVARPVIRPAIDE